MGRYGDLLKLLRTIKLDSKSGGPCAHEGSNPSFGTIYKTLYVNDYNTSREVSFFMSNFPIDSLCIDGIT